MSPLPSLTCVCYYTLLISAESCFAHMQLDGRHHAPCPYMHWWLDAETSLKEYDTSCCSVKLVPAALLDNVAVRSERGAVKSCTTLNILSSSDTSRSSSTAEWCVPCYLICIMWRTQYVLQYILFLTVLLMCRVLSY